jgi:hypothetical protein
MHEIQGKTFVTKEVLKREGARRKNKKFNYFAELLTDQAYKLYRIGTHFLIEKS